jgi:16S rRNA G966 N2-methylase RsmD
MENPYAAGKGKRDLPPPATASVTPDKRQGASIMGACSSARESAAYACQEPKRQCQWNLKDSVSKGDARESVSPASALPTEKTATAERQGPVKCQSDPEAMELYMSLEKLIKEGELDPRYQISLEPCGVPRSQVPPLTVDETYECCFILKSQTKAKLKKYENCNGRMYQIRGFLLLKQKETYAIVEEMLEPAKSFIGGEFSKLEEEQKGEEPWPTWHQVNGCSLISGETKLLPLKLLKNRIASHPRPKIMYSETGQGDNLNIQYRHFSLPKAYTVGDRTLPRKPVAIDLFAGAGGMSLGLERAGFDVKYSVEYHHKYAQTLKANMHRRKIDAKVFNETVQAFLDSVEARAPGYPLRGDADHVHASPPCKGFSKANRCVFLRLTHCGFSN